MKLRQQAIKESGCSKVILACDEIQSQDYRSYLFSCFDDVISWDTVADLDPDTVVLRDPALDYDAYAKATVAAALKAIARDESPMDHHIRV